jgi:hypothetical protein
MRTLPWLLCPVFLLALALGSIGCVPVAGIRMRVPGVVDLRSTVDAAAAQAPLQDKGNCLTKTNSISIDNDWGTEFYAMNHPETYPTAEMGNAMAQPGAILRNVGTHTREFKIWFGGGRHSTVTLETDSIVLDWERVQGATR